MHVDAHGMAEPASKRQSSESSDDNSQDADADPPAPPTGKRRRVGLACNACRVRKSRCDGQRPSCSSCLSLGLDCAYEPWDSVANVIVRKDYVCDLEQRVAVVEQRLQQLGDVLKGHLAPCRGHGSAGPRLPGASTAPATPHGCALATGLEEPQDEDASTNGMAMTFVEEQSCAYFGESSNIHFTRLLLRGIAAVHQPPPGQDVASEGDPAGVFGSGEALMAAGISQGTPYHPDAGGAHGQGPSTPREPSPTALPPAEEMDALLDMYFSTAGAVFPVIHEGAMRDRYAECRRSGFARVPRTWLGILNMMFAMASSFDTDAVPSARERFERSNVFYKRALGLCGDLSRRVISLDVVHWLLLVVIHCQGTQRSVQAWNHHGLAVRSAVALGLHSDAAARGLDPVAREYRRRTWRVIYCLDKVLSVAFGRPASVPDEQVTVGQSPPAGLGGGSDGGADLPGEFLAVSFALYQIMGRSLANQYGANLEGASWRHADDMDSLKASGELRKMLRDWAAGLPPHLRLCKPGCGTLAHNTPANRFRVILTMRYYNLCILIHKPLLSATISHLFRIEQDTDEKPAYLAQLAMAEAHECVRAAQHTINLVHSIISTDHTSKNNLGVWFYTLYYVFTASLVVCSRLLWAQHPTAASDDDDAAVHESRVLLAKAEAVCNKLDHENSLVWSCREYIRRLARMCSSIRDAYPCEGDEADAASAPNPTLSDGRSMAASAGSPETAAPPGVADVEAFRLFYSEIIDHSILEGFFQSPVEGMSFMGCFPSS